MNNSISQVVVAEGPLDAARIIETGVPCFSFGADRFFSMPSIARKPFDRNSYKNGMLVSVKVLDRLMSNLDLSGQKPI